MSQEKQVKKSKIELPAIDAISDVTDPQTEKVSAPFKNFKDDDEVKLEALIKRSEEKIEAGPKEPDMYIFKLLLYADQKPKAYESIVNEMPVYDEKSNSVRTIRLIRGASSIWLDEQEGFTPQYIQRNKQDIVFNNGYLRVPRTNRTLLNFLLNSDEYDKKPNRLRTKKPKFTLVNTAEVESNELEKEVARLRAINFAMNASDEDMIIHADFLGINMMNEFGENKTTAKIRVEYANKAGQNPSYFMSTAGTSASKIQYFVKKAIAEGHLDLVSKKGYASWAESKTIICEIPFGKKPQEAITEFIQSKTKEANSFFDQLKSSVVGV